MNQKETFSNKRKRHIFIVSDATGSTCETVVLAALSQFNRTDIILHKKRYVQHSDEVKKVVEEAIRVDGIIAYTLVSPELRELMENEGRKSAVPTIDVLGPLLARFTDYLEISPMAIPNLFRNLDKEYFQRIECINFAVKHDDGMKIEDLNKTDVVLVGPSRTSKTPISIYLAYRGYLAANVPIVYRMPIPRELLRIDRNKVIGLIISPYRLKKIREVRLDRYPHIELKEYIDLDFIRRELDECKKIYAKYQWRTVDVTSKSIEEAATEIMRLFGNKKIDRFYYEETL
jgi:hypothetical protein